MRVPRGVLSILAVWKSICVSLSLTAVGRVGCLSTLLKKNVLAAPTLTMFSAFGQFASTSQFYLYGRSHCTQTGWKKASNSYAKPDILEHGRETNIDLTGKVFIVTGANAGIGREIATFLARNNASVYMVCRNKSRGEQALKEIELETKCSNNIHMLIADCGLERDVRRVWSEFVAHRESLLPGRPVTLDALVCNAGALLADLTFTEEDVEVTFATHLLFGTYLFGELALPVLENTPGSRLVIVSSGGMYNSKFPSWDVATSMGTAKYDGQFAYVYAKRGQVLLAEKWAEQYEGRVKVVSCHPGWVDTVGVDSAYGASKRYLEPLRTLWEGSEGIVWLCVCPSEQLESGAFYLDRSPQVKHMAGPFFTEGSFTKNEPSEVNDMMTNLKLWSSASQRPSREELERRRTLLLPLQCMSRPINIESFMGDWYVCRCIENSLSLLL